MRDVGLLIFLSVVPELKIQAILQRVVEIWTNFGWCPNLTFLSAKFGIDRAPNPLRD
jgi:hypothetical protein